MKIQIDALYESLHYLEQLRNNGCVYQKEIRDAIECGIDSIKEKIENLKKRTNQ